MKYSCLIIDSNKFFSGILSELINQSPDLDLIDVINVSDHQPQTGQAIDVIFYDPDVLRSLPADYLDSIPGNPQLILISADEAYAIQALMSDVTDFLEKSILTAERFAQTVSLIKSNAAERIPTYGS